eukprot:s1047_g10.t2
MELDNQILVEALLLSTNRKARPRNGSRSPAAAPSRQLAGEGICDPVFWFLLKILILRALVRKFRGPLDSPRGRIEHRIPSKATAVRMFSPPGTSQLGSA